MKNVFLAAVLAVAVQPGLRASPVDEGTRLMDSGRTTEAIAVLEKEAKAHPGSSETLLNLGWAYWRARRLDEAYDIGNTLIKLDPKNPTFIVFLASTEIERGAYPRAADLAREVLRVSPDDKDASLVLARALFKLQREKEAMGVLDRVIRQNPGYASAAFRKASFLAEMGRREEALACYDKLLRSEPRNSQYRRARAKVLYDLGRTEEAKKEWRSLSRQEPDSESLLNLGWACWRDKDFAEAKRIGTTLIRLDPRNPAFLSFLANTEAELGAYEEARRLAGMALQLAPRDKEASMALARALFRLKREDEALKIVDDILAAHPDDVDAVYRKGGFLMEMGRQEQALVCFDRALRSDPANASYRRSRARALFDLGREDEAKGEWRRLVQSDNDPQAMLNLGWAYWHEGDQQQAWNIGSTLLKLDENNPGSLRLMANMELDRMNYPEALRLAQKALRLAPGDRDASVMAARALFRLQREGEAIPILRGLIQRYPDNLAIQYHWADCLMRLGRLDEALVYYERLVLEDPSKDAYRMGRAYVWYELGRFDLAVAEWRRMVERPMPNLDAMRRLRTDAANRRLWPEAIAWQTKLAGMEPKNPEEWETLAKFYAQAKDDRACLDAAQRAVAADPLYHGGYNQLAEAYERLEDYEGARKTYEAMLERNRNSKRALEGLSYALEAREDFAGALRYVRRRQAASFTPSPYDALHEARLMLDYGRLDKAASLTAGVERSKPAAFTMLLYHGISPHDRSDAIPQKDFREQMLALKRAGYQSVTMEEIDRFLSGKGALPDKALAVTFDDGRADSFENADPALKETGFKGTMFVHTSKQRKWHFHANADEIRKWQATGRWDIQSHGYEAHDPMVLDPTGRKAHFLTNRRWLDEEGRMETVEEYKARVDRELRTARTNIEEAFPGGRVLAFAFPFGDFGQEDFSNAAQAVAANRASIKKYYRLAVVQDAWGLNWKDSDRFDLRRYEVPRYMTADQLVEQLASGDPSVQARMLEAEIWVRSDQPARAQAIYESLEAQGIRDPKLWARKGIAVEATGDSFAARRLYAQASSVVAGGEAYGSGERFDKLLRKSDIDNGPKVGTDFTGFSDSQANSNTKLMLRTGAPVKNVRLQVWAGQSHYLQRTEQETRLTGREAGLQLNTFPVPKLGLEGSFSRLFLVDRGGLHSDTFNGALEYQVLPQLKAGVRGGGGNVDTAVSIAAGRLYTTKGVTMAWDPALQWRLTGSYDNLRYNDSNRQNNVLLQLTKGLPLGLSVGGSFQYGDSRFQTPEYYTPRNLSEYKGLVSLRQPFGPRSALTSQPRGNAGITYEGGYGFQAGSSRAVHSVVGTLSWKLVDSLALSAQAAYTSSPVYISRWASGGLSLSY